ALEARLEGPRVQEADLVVECLQRAEARVLAVRARADEGEVEVAGQPDRRGEQVPVAALREVRRGGLREGRIERQRLRRRVGQVELRPVRVHGEQPQRIEPARAEVEVLGLVVGLLRPVERRARAGRERGGALRAPTLDRRDAPCRVGRAAAEPAAQGSDEQAAHRPPPIVAARKASISPNRWYCCRRSSIPCRARGYGMKRKRLPASCSACTSAVLFLRCTLSSIVACASRSSPWSSAAASSTEASR